MKFLATTFTPRLTVSKTSKACIFDKAKNTITLTESTVTIELSIPSILVGLKDALSRLITVLAILTAHLAFYSIALQKRIKCNLAEKYLALQKSMQKNMQNIIYTYFLPKLVVI